MIILYLVCGYYVIGICFNIFAFVFIKKHEPDFMSSTPAWANVIVLLLVSFVWVGFVMDFVGYLEEVYSKD